MAHFAKVLKGKVIDVIVAEQDYIDSFVDDTPGTWVKTSYNMRGGVLFDGRSPAADQSEIAGDGARERKNFAGVNWGYDGIGFYPPKPYDSWTLNTTTYLWEPPVEKPEGSYIWNEETQSWDAVEPE